ncbi:hypothetical protein GC197_09830 [bacterium]|nr:hypothetical protein [bacterium]
MTNPTPQLVSDKSGMWLLVHGLRVLTSDDPIRPGEFKIVDYAGRYCLSESGWSTNIKDAVTFIERDDAEQYRDRRSLAYRRQQAGEDPGEGVPWEPLPE